MLLTLIPAYDFLIFLKVKYIFQKSPDPTFKPMVVFKNNLLVYK